jgi:pilus assembly protein CpaF
MTPDHTAAGHSPASQLPAVAADEPNRLAALPLFATPVLTSPAPAAAPPPSPVALHAVPSALDAPGAWQPTASPPTAAPSQGSSATAVPAAAGWRPTTVGSADAAPVPPAAPAAPAGDVDWGQVRAFRQQAAELLTAQLRDRLGLDEATRREIGRALIVSMLNDHADSLLAQGTPGPTPAAQHALSTAIFDSLFGLGRLQPLVDDPDVENIEIRGYDRVHLVYGDGRVQVGPPVADSDEELIETLAFLASQSGRSFTPLNWELDLRLHGGHRLAARAWRCPRPTVVIRIHRYTDVDLADLQRLGMVDDVLAQFLGAAVRAGKAIVVSGAQGAGKTTLVRALCNEMDPWESLATIETEFELHLNELPDRHHRVVPYEGRPGSGERGLDGRSAGEVTLDGLLYSVLRTNVSRIIVGEVRGPEVIPMLKAAQSSTGTLSTTHAHSARAAIERLATCALESGPHVTSEFAYLLIAGGIDLIVQIGVQDDTSSGGRKQRYVSEVLEVGQGENGRPALTDVFSPNLQGRAVPRTRPSFLADLQRAGFDPAWLDQTNGTWTHHTQTHSTRSSQSTELSRSTASGGVPR